ncbi:hypothetical protein [Actinobacillus equuli]|uniref:hypothetical protein n=1 Tax=Actinobacillus equuli TaxID=718 RepID=UPI001013CBA2|nr:hypothetical protein [Actinobacillus equuli]
MLDKYEKPEKNIEKPKSKTSTNNTECVSLISMNQIGDISYFIIKKGTTMKELLTLIILMFVISKNSNAKQQVDISNVNDLKNDVSTEFKHICFWRQPFLFYRRIDRI